MFDINVDYDGDNSGEIRATQQQKCGQLTPIAKKMTPSKNQQFISKKGINKRRYKERFESFTVTMNRRTELAALVKNEKIEALTVTLERRRKLVKASILNQKIEINGEAIIRDWRNELVDYGIERQKYYDEYLNECTAARKSEKADYVAATDEYNNECTAVWKAKRADYVAVTATMIANTWTLNDDSNREAEENTIIDTLRNSKDDDGLGKDTANAVLILWKTK